VGAGVRMPTLMELPALHESSLTINSTSVSIEKSPPVHVSTSLSILSMTTKHSPGLISSPRPGNKSVAETWAVPKNSHSPTSTGTGPELQASTDKTSGTKHVPPCPTT